MAASPRASRPPSGGALQVTAMKPGAHNDLFEEDPMSGENLTRLSDNALTYAAPGLFGVAGTAMAAGATVRFDVVSLVRCCAIMCACTRRHAQSQPVVWCSCMKRNAGRVLRVLPRVRTCCVACC